MSGAPFGRTHFSTVKDGIVGAQEFVWWVVVFHALIDDCSVDDLNYLLVCPWPCRVIFFPYLSWRGSAPTLCCVKTMWFIEWYAMHSTPLKAICCVYDLSFSMQLLDLSIIRQPVSRWKSLLVKKLKKSCDS